MAIYNPPANQEEPNFLRYSQSPPNVRPNLGIGQLIGNIGELFGDAVAGLDTINQQNIQNTAYDQIDQAAREATPNLADLTGTPQQTPAQQQFDAGSMLDDRDPAAFTNNIRPQINTLNNLQLMKNAGKINQTLFDARVDAIASDLRAKYPGYRAHIDKIVSGTVGASTANDLRRSTIGLIESLATQQSTAQAAWEKEVLQHADDFESPALLREALSATDPMQQRQIRASIGTQKILKGRIDQRVKELNLLEAEGKLDANKADTAFIGLAGDVYLKHQNRAEMALKTKLGVSSLTEALGKLNEQNIKTAAGPILGVLDQIEAGYLSEMQTLRNQRVIETRDQTGTFRSFAMIGDRTRQDQAIKDNLLFLGELRKAIGGGDLPQIKRTAALVENIKANDEFRAMQQEHLRAYRTIKDMLGQDTATQMLHRMAPNGKSMMHNLLKDMFTMELEKMSYGGSADSTLSKSWSRLDALRRDRPDITNNDRSIYIKDLTQRMAQLAKDPSVPDDLKKNITSAIASVENALVINKYPIEQKISALGMLADKDTIKAIKDFTPEGFEQYANWTSEIINDVFRNSAATVRQEMQANPNIKLNPETLRIDFLRSPVARGANTSLSKTINQINQGLDIRENMLTEMGVQNPREYLIKDLELLGIKVKDPSTSPSGGRTGAIQEPSVQLASLENNAPAGFSGAPRGIPELNLDLVNAVTGQNPISQVIGAAESAGGDYNIILGGRRMPLTNMTIAEVQNLQKEMVASGMESGAVGKYQTIGKTLARAVRRLGLDPNTTKFDQKTQDAIGEYLIMKEAGGEKYLAGDISKKEFADKLAKVWAGLPLSSGKSAYAGVGSNRANVSRERVLKAIDAWVGNKSGITDISGRSRTNIPTEEEDIDVVNRVRDYDSRRRYIEGQGIDTFDQRFRGTTIDQEQLKELIDEERGKRPPIPSYGGDAVD